LRFRQQKKPYPPHHPSQNRSPKKKVFKYSGGAVVGKWLDVIGMSCENLKRDTTATEHNTARPSIHVAFDDDGRSEDDPMGHVSFVVEKNGTRGVF
jgi:hypothetical protein